ncbi:hypothetical protein SDC9_96282 [bioreactor metagenome]|uniref:Uncharacterized protein n=1 Tax=bioreactor metagenome TaxID=1076179 RepID=A0A645A8U5_9ZZZZ
MVNGALFHGVPVEILPGPPGRGQKARNRQKLPCIQSAAPVRPVQSLPHRLEPGKGRTAPQPDHLTGRVGLVQKPQDLLRLRLRRQGQGAALCLVTDGLSRQQCQYLGQLQRPHGFFK